MFCFCTVSLHFRDRLQVVMKWSRTTPFQSWHYANWSWSTAPTVSPVLTFSMGTAGAFTTHRTTSGNASEIHVTSIPLRTCWEFHHCFFFSLFCFVFWQGIPFISELVHVLPCVLQNTLRVSTLFFKPFELMLLLCLTLGWLRGAMLSTWPLELVTLQCVMLPYALHVFQD